MHRPVRQLRILGGIAAAALCVAQHAPAARAQASSAPWLDAFREPASRLIGAALADRAAWAKLAELTDTFAPRLGGSPGLERAIAWAVDRMRRDGLENVRAEPVKVPHWVRGRESLELLDPVPRPLVMLGLGGSVGTPPEGVTASVLVVSSFDDLEARGREAAGRIVLYNVPFTDYGATVPYRARGASRAAQFGAVAALVRSVGPTGLRTPHTGSLSYAPEVARIPAAAISVEDAEQLQRMQDRREAVRVRLVMEANTLPDADSANVVGEIVGRERPEEIVVLGCHLDSWDVGTGAIDDGGGCVAAWEAVRLMKATGLRPRRTVRAVLFTNEENGLRGGLAYRDAHRAELANHLLMIEADLGFFPPLAFGFSGNDAARATASQVASLLDGIDAGRVGASGGGADIGPSVQAASIPAMSFNGDAKAYFMYHHTPADTIDRVVPLDLSRAVAALSVMAYVVADAPQRLGDGGTAGTR